MDAAADDADILYGDLDAHGRGSRVSSAVTSTAAIARMNVKVHALEADNAQLRADATALREKLSTLEANASCLYNTATAEIGRKDAEIARLRALVKKAGLVDDA
jgi:hypothetical protein